MSGSEGGGSSWQQWIDGADLPVEPPVPVAADEEFLRRLSLPPEEPADEPVAAPLDLALPAEPAPSEFAPPAAAPVPAPAAAPASSPAPVAARASDGAPLLPQVAAQVDAARAAVDELADRLDRLEEMVQSTMRAVDDRLDEQGAQLALVVEELGRLRKRIPLRAREGGLDQPMVERMADVIVERLAGQFDVVVEPEPMPASAPKRSGRAPLRAGQTGRS